MVENTESMLFKDTSTAVITEINGTIRTQHSIHSRSRGIRRNHNAYLCMKYRKTMHYRTVHVNLQIIK